MGSYHKMKAGAVFCKMRNTAPVMFSYESLHVSVKEQAIYFDLG